MSAGEVALGGFGDIEEAQAIVAGDEADERMDARRLLRAAGDASQGFQRVRLLQGQQTLPAGEGIVIGDGDGQRAAIAEVVAALAEGVGQFVADDAAIEGVAGDGDAAGGEDGEGGGGGAGGFTGANCVAGAKRFALYDADIEGAAAEIEDEQGLGSGGLEIGAEGIGIGGGDGFVGEVDALEAGQEGRLQHTGLGEGILLGVIGVAHGAAEDDFGEGGIQGDFGAAAGAVEVEGDDVFKEVEILTDGGAEVALGREAALEAEEETAGREDVTLDVDIAQEGGQLGEGELDFADVDALELDGAVEVLLVVVRDGGLAEVELAVVGEVESAAGDGGVGGARIEGEQAEPGAVVVGDAGVGGAEIYADAHGGLSGVGAEGIGG